MTGAPTEMPPCAGTHRPPAGPNEDTGWCSRCQSPTYAMRPEGETFGLHADDCSLPLRHEGECAPGGSGHPVADVVRGWWSGFYEDIAAARERHGSTGPLVWREGGWWCLAHGPLYGVRGESGNADIMPTCGVCGTAPAPPRTHGKVLTDAEAEMLAKADAVLCPECVQGKCVNCTGDVLTDDDVLEPCAHRADKVHP